MYLKLIRESCDCDTQEAKVIERIMRVERPTLDSLDRPTFRRLARRSHEVLKELRKSDPKTARAYEAEAH